MGIGKEEEIIVIVIVVVVAFLSSFGFIWFFILL
jgi:hypothetical protein